MSNLPLAEQSIMVKDQPWRTIALSVANTIVSWGTGTLIFYFINPWTAAGYLLLCLCVLVMPTYFRCRYCVYYGRRCTSGLGLISSRLFRKGDPAGFCDPKNIYPVAIPSFAVLLLPLAGGVVGMALNFSWIMAGLTVFYAIAVMGGGFFFQRKVACKDCAQGRIGCPANRRMHGGKPK
ncbi:MAG: hypothetical protein WBZ29_16185 [Methanocella sp.]